MRRLLLCVLICLCRTGSEGSLADLEIAKVFDRVATFSSSLKSWHDLNYQSPNAIASSSSRSQHRGRSYSRSSKWNHFRRLHTLSLKKPANISCPELNVTFTNAPPFDVLGVPECGASVNPELMLYLPDPDADVSCKIDPFFLPNKETTLCFEALERQEQVSKVVMVIHGFLKEFSTDWLHEVQRDIQEVDPNTAVIIVGWGHGIFDILSYWRAASNTRYIAQVMYLTVKALRMTVKRPIYVHCAGHSLGAQACGFAGKLLKADPAGWINRMSAETGSSSLMLDRISGMDPAGPLFCNDVPYPFNYLDIKPDARLGPNDAKLVDVIHTDGDARYIGLIVPQYGTMERLGTVDFYPGSRDYYGHNQPGCLDFINVISCSHSRARQLFQASIKAEVCLASKRCSGDPHKIPNDCEALTDVEVAMGYWWDAKNPLPGMYVVEEVARFPYCKETVAKYVSS